MSWMDKITIGITWHLRDRDLGQCLESCERFAPGVRVISHACPKGNLSIGRNELVDKIRTPFYFMLEEDMRLSVETDMGLMMRISESAELAGVSGVLHERGRRAIAGQFRHRKKLGVSLMPIQTVSWTLRGEPYVQCDCISNWGLFRTGALREVRWDPRMALQEHYEYFWRLSQAGYRSAVCLSGVSHHKSRPTEEYRIDRKRASREYKSMERSLMGGFRVARNLDVLETLEKSKAGPIRRRQTRIPDSGRPARRRTRRPRPQERE